MNASRHPRHGQDASTTEARGKKKQDDFEVDTARYSERDCSD
jgi:hypothetical protein